LRFSSVLVKVENISEEAPRFPGGNHQVLYVSENIHGAYPLTIGTLKVVDIDRKQNGTLSYSLLQGNNSLFLVIPQTGELQVTGNLDRELQEQYELVVQANDLGTPKRLSATVAVTIRVLDVNDHEPVFEQPQYYIEVMENEPVLENSTLLCTKATDLDAPEFSTGELQITGNLDRELQEQHELVVQANDLGTPKRLSATVAVTIRVLDVNDHEPVFEQPQYYIEVMENEPVLENSTLLCTKATDLDAPEFSVIRYELTGAELMPFSINLISGCIQRLDVLDREFRSEWILNVTAYDNGKFVERSSTALVYVRVLDQNDNAPIILNEQLDIFIRKGIKKGEVVYVLNAYDPDDHVLHYSLSGSNALYFNILQNGVIVAVRELVMQDYSLTAVVADRRGLNTSVDLAFYTAEATKFPIFKVTFASFLFPLKKAYVFLVRLF
uniref:CA domain-containing protein n=1 Tax=Gongylonema pulchrum TaxID=637853 RepID=A0A183E9K9_9BILA